MDYNVNDVYGKTDGYKPNLVDFTLIMHVIKVDWHTEVSLIFGFKLRTKFCMKVPVYTYRHSDETTYTK